MMEETAEVARLARQHSVGLVATPADGANLARVVKQAADDRATVRMMGQRARRLAEERFDRRLVTRQYADMIAAVSQLPA